MGVRSPITVVHPPPSATHSRTRADGLVLAPTPGGWRRAAGPRRTIPSRSGGAGGRAALLQQRLGRTRSACGPTMIRADIRVTAARRRPSSARGAAPRAVRVAAAVGATTGALPAARRPRRSAGPRHDARRAAARRLVARERKNEGERGAACSPARSPSGRRSGACARFPRGRPRTGPGPAMRGL